MNRDYEATLDLEELEDMEGSETTLDLEELEDMEEFEDWEMEGLGELEDMEEFEDWEAPPAARTRRGPITMPPIHIRVRPAVVLGGFDHNQTALKPAAPYNHLGKIKLVANRVISSWRRGGPRPGRGYSAIRLVGHTDSTGNASYNEKLGKRRTRTVKARLIPAIRAEFQQQVRRFGRRAFPPRIRIRLVKQSLGEKRPVANNRTNAGRARNRRVEVFLSRI